VSLLQLPKQGLNVIQSGRNYLDTLANKYVVKPKSVKGIGGFVFDYETDTSVTLQSEITDHYAEDGTTVNDHIVIKPVRLALRGYVGELVYAKQTGLLGMLNLVQSKLSMVPAYLGKYTPQALGKVTKVLGQATSVVNKVDNALARVKNIVGIFDKSAPQSTKQAKAFAQLEALQASGQVFLVETPYKVFDNMTIEQLVVTQSEDTKFQSDISVTLKQLRFVSTQLVTAGQDRYGGRLANQIQPSTNKGLTKGTPVPMQSLFSKGAGYFGSKLGL
jgi:hypothetical protein